PDRLDSIASRRQRRSLVYSGPCQILRRHVVRRSLCTLDVAWCEPGTTDQCDPIQIRQRPAKLPGVSALTARRQQPRGRGSSRRQTNDRRETAISLNGRIEHLGVERLGEKPGGASSARDVTLEVVS